MPSSYICITNLAKERQSQLETGAFMMRLPKLTALSLTQLPNGEPTFSKTVVFGF